MNSDLQGRYRFDVFSEVGKVEAEARTVVEALRAAAGGFEGGAGEERVLLPSLRLAIAAAEHLLDGELEDNLVGGDEETDLRCDKLTELARALNRGEKMVELMEAGAGPEAIAELRGDMRIGYRSSVDGSEQPFCLFVPFDYDSGKRWPLMVRLHGMWTKMGDAEWNLQTYEWDREFVRYAPRGSFVELYPWGRGNEGYRESGLRDVLDTMALVEELFSIDEDRVYIMGSSMGGAGAWRIAAEYPERFAALCCVVGVYDEKLVEKLAKLPVMFHYGGLDRPERVTSPEETAELLRELGGEVEVVGHPASGHRIETTDYQLAYYRFFAKHRRR